MTFNITKHQLVSKHTKANDSEKKALFEKYNINGQALPKILKDDPAIAHLSVKAGDVIKIERVSKTAGVTYYYRLVIGG
ncbi:MAG: DNA-directed RNA polymerase subunit H [Nanoarchaeota archaeon]